MAEQRHLRPPVTASRVRYIKQGVNGCWENEAIEKGIVLLDFDSGRPSTYALCVEGRWQELLDSWAADRSRSVASRYTNETRTFFEDPGEILWVTFAHDRLYWGLLEPGLPQIYKPNDATSTSTYRTVRGGWSDRDISGTRVLTKTSLPGSITSAASYRGTSFELGQRERERLIQRVNGTADPAITRVTRAQEEMRQALGALVQRLGPQDFEMLVDMLFLGAGWRRQGLVGGTEKTKDLDLVMPVTGETAWVQVKCRTDLAALASYLADSERMEHYNRMFFVYHTGENIECDRDKVHLLGLQEVVDMVINGGFVGWVIERVG